MNSSPNKISNDDNPGASEFDSLTQVEFNQENAENKNAEQFTSRQLERIAKITNRQPDDNDVITLNLALAYRKFQQLRAMIEKNDRDNENSGTKTMVQRGVMEDLATAKRELEEAMYLYDQQFAQMDEENSRKQSKDSYLRHERAESGATHEEAGDWLKAYQARKARQEGYEQQRDTRAEDLTGKLDNIVNGVEGSEIFKTYQYYKDEYPEDPIRNRRDGFDGAGKKGLMPSGVYGNIDWKLYPHAPAERDDNNEPNPGDDEPTGDEDPDKDPNPDPDPNGEENPDKDPEGDGNKVDLDVKIKGIEQEFEQSRKERLEELEGKLGKMKPELAELYARNRRLFVGKANRAEFIKVQGEYKELMDEYLRLKGKESYEAGKHEIADYLEDRIEQLTSEIQEKLNEFVGGDPENSTKTQEEVDAEKQKLIEEAEKKLREEYGDRVDALKTKINAEFVEDYIKEASELEDSTIDALDNGTLCRKFVNKVLNNKILKGVLIGAGIAGLAVTGVGLIGGLAAGTMSIGLSFTAGGIAAGAAKGAFSGALMSRQNSKNSAVRGFASEEEIRKNLEGIDITDKNSDTANVAEYLMSQYDEAKNSDLKSNRKKTLISAGIGAAIGALMSGVQINNVETSTNEVKQVVGNEPTEIRAANLDNVNIPEGHGAYDTFTQLGGSPENYSKFEAIMTNLDPKYGLAPGSNGEVAGINGIVGNFAHTYPGTINTWPDAAQSYITEVANEAARQGLIPGFQTGGAPIYNTITQIVTKEVPNAFMNFLTRATATIGAGIIGSKIGNSETVRNNSDTESTPESPATEEPTTDETEPISIDTTPEAPSGEAPEGSNTEIEAETEAEAEDNGFEEIENSDLYDELFEGEETTPTAENTPDDIAEQINRQLRFREQVEDSLGNVIGDNGVSIVAERGTYTDATEFANRAEAWWNSLSDDVKESVRSFERSVGDSDLGTPLRNWLSSKGEL